MDTGKVNMTNTDEDFIARAAAFDAQLATWRELKKQAGLKLVALGLTTQEVKAILEGPNDLAG